MKKLITKQDILDLLERQSRTMDENIAKSRAEAEKRQAEAEKRREEHRAELEEEFKKSREEAKKHREEHRAEVEEEFKKSRAEAEKRQAEFNKQLGSITGTWGKFVSEMVRPKVIDLFQAKGIQIETSVQGVKGYVDKQIYYEIDLLLINSSVAVIVEVKSTLRIEDIDEHIERMEKIKLVSPKGINISGVTMYGAVAGMIIDNDADRYAYKKGFYVLRQKNTLVEIVNDSKFQPKTWKTNY